MLIGSRKKGLLDKTETSKVEMTDHDFVIVIGTLLSRQIKKQWHFAT